MQHVYEYIFIIKFRNYKNGNKYEMWNIRKSKLLYRSDRSFSVIRKDDWNLKTYLKNFE